MNKTLIIIAVILILGVIGFVIYNRRRKLSPEEKWAQLSPAQQEASENLAFETLSEEQLFS